MMLFAVSDVVWQAVIAAGLAIVLAWMSQRAAKAAAEAALAVEKVRGELAKSTVSTNTKLDAVAEKVEVVHKATNSMKEELVKVTDKEAFARGVKSETDKK